VTLADRLAALSAPQRAAVMTDAPTAVSAVPGAGKTQVLALRFARLLAAGVAPERVLALTFSRRAAGELRDRIVAVCAGTGVAERPDRLDVRTFHGFATRALEGDGPRFRSGRLLDGISAAVLLAEAVARTPFASLAAPSVRSRSFTQDVTPLLADLARLTPALRRGLAAEATPRVRDLLALFDAREELRERLGATELDALVATLVARAADRQCPPARYLAGRYAHVLVDEFQDVDAAQLGLLGLLAAGGATLFAVGDPRQAIYRFRGAGGDAGEHGARELGLHALDLRDSRRCAQVVCDFASRTPLLAGAMHAVDRDRPGAVAVLAARTTADEADLIAGEIAVVIAAGTPAERIAVLARSARPLLPAVAEALRARGIAVVAIDRDAFLADPLVTCVRATLRVLRRPSDSAAWAALLATEPFGANYLRASRALHDATRGAAPLDRLVAVAPDLGLDGPAICAAYRAATAAWAADEPARALRLFLRDARALRRVVAGDPRAARCSLGRLRTMLAAVDRAHRANVRLERGATSEAAAHAIDEHLAALGAEDEPPADDAPGVRLLSIHAAKGLEFDMVVLGDAAEGRLPQRPRATGLLGAADRALLDRYGIAPADPREALVEEASLWYVAATRARTRLLVTYATEDADGAVRAPSRFLAPADLPTDVRVRAEASAQAAPPVAPAPDPIAPPAAMAVRDAETWLHCPRRFAYKRLWRVPEERSESALLGTLVHGTLQAYHERVVEVDGPRIAAGAVGDELIALLETAFAADPQVAELAPPLQAALLRDARARLRAYAEWLAREAAARPFRVLACERAVELAVGDVRLRGSIDRIDERRDGARVLRDFKTGRLRKKFAPMLAAFGEAPAVGDVDPRFNAQLALYARAEPRASVLSYVFLGGDAEDGRVAVADEADLGSAAAARGVAAVHETLAAAFAAAAPSRSTFATARREAECERCAYASICIRGDDAFPASELAAGTCA